MKVALIGSTGFLGSHVLNELLSRGYSDITAIARNVDKIQNSNKINKVAVDVLDHENFVKALQGNDVVISTFSSGYSHPNPHSYYLQGAEAIQQAVKDAGVKRFIVIGGAGSLQIAGHRLIDSPEFPEEFKALATGPADYLDIIKNEQDLDWTFFSPAINMHQGTSGVRKGIYRTGLDSPVVDENGQSTLSGEDVGTVIVDELENKKFIKKRFTAAY